MKRLIRKAGDKLQGAIDREYDSDDIRKIVGDYGTWFGNNPNYLQNPNIIKNTVKNMAGIRDLIEKGQPIKRSDISPESKDASNRFEEYFWWWALENVLPEDNSEKVLDGEEKDEALGHIEDGIDTMDKGFVLAKYFKQEVQDYVGKYY